MNKRSVVEQMIALELGLRGAVVIVTGAATWITLLLSPLASFLTGAVIPLDGGQVIDRE